MAWEYLNEGEMVRPFGIFGMEKIILHSGVGEKAISPVLYQCYKKSDGSLGQIMVNYTDKNVKFYLDDISDVLIYTSPNGEAKKMNDNFAEIESLSAIMLERCGE